jgi:ABC-2 type transport system permease protein
LRWRLFVNSLRRRSRRSELGMQVLFFLFAGGFVTVTSMVFLAGTVGLLKIQRTDLLDLLLWAVFLVWQLAPILFEGYSPGLSFREVARYPISFRVFYLLSSAYGISDPAAITCSLWLLSIWLGVLIQRSEWAPAAALALLLFAVFNLLLNRIVIGLFERFQSTRKGRERMVFLMFIVILLPQLLQFATGYWTNMRLLKLPPWLLDWLTPIREFSPPGMAVRMFLPSDYFRLWAFVALLLYAGLVFLLLRRQLWTIYQGEIYAETYKVRRELKVQKGWRFPFVDEVTAAIIEKELRYIRQSSRFLLQLIYPPIIFMLVAFNGPGRRLFFAKSPEALLAGMAGFILLSVPNMAYNVFGMDKEGFDRWLLCPAPLRKVLLGKNLTHAGIFTALYLLTGTIVIIAFHPRLLSTAPVTLAFFIALLVHLGAGNLISVYWPKRIELTQMNSKIISGAAGLASLLVLASLGVIVGVVFLAAWYWQLSWLPLVCALVLLAAALRLYSYLLDRSAGYLWQHIEEITGNLGA